MSQLWSQSHGRLCILDSLWIRDDADSSYFEYGLEGTPPVWTATTGVSTLAPESTVNVSTEMLGTAFYMYSADDGLYHRFVMTATNEPDTIYIWTDAEQLSTAPSLYRTVKQARMDDGFYMVDEKGALIHKMGQDSGTFAELNQGLVVPL